MVIRCSSPGLGRFHPTDGGNRSEYRPSRSSTIPIFEFRCAADSAGRNVGLSPDAAFAALQHAAAGPGLKAVTVSEVNPQHGAADGSKVAMFAQRLAGALV